MLLNALILGAEVSSMNFYDQMTGVAKPGYSVRMTVLDEDTKEKYECQFTGGFDELEEIKQLRTQGASQDQIDEAAQRLRANLPKEYTRLTVEVAKIKGKGSFMTLVCRLPQPAAV